MEGCVLGCFPSYEQSSIGIIMGGTTTPNMVSIRGKHPKGVFWVCSELSAPHFARVSSSSSVVTCPDLQAQHRPETLNPKP